MCITVKVGEEYCDGLDELRAILPVVVLDKDYTEPLPENSCLCPVDIDATAVANGMWVYQPLGGDPMEYWLNK